MGTGRGSRIVVALGAIVAASLLMLAGAGSATARALDFHQCKRPGHEAFECATMRVPLKLPAGRPRQQARKPVAKRTIGIHVERHKRSGDHETALIALAGGPGQAASDFAPDSAKDLAPAWRGERQFVTLDQRGTGKSGYLDCDLESASGRATVALSRCSRQIGDAARWYRTADSVADLQRLRHELGVSKLMIFGVSYGTNVAAQYARTYPARTDGLILDSVFSGWDPLLRPSFEASPRVLDAFCAAGACNGITPDPVTDVADLVAAIGRGIDAKVIDEDGKPVEIRINPGSLVQSLTGTDLNAAARAYWPAAIAAANAGDTAPVARLVGLLGGGGGSGAEAGGISFALNTATNCADTANPWTTSTSIPARKQATGALVDSTPESTWGPFNARAAYSNSIAAACWGWQFGPQANALTRAPLPDVPALLVEGEEDLRTPIETMQQVAAELPQAAVTVIGNQGHSAMAGECAQASLRAWVDGGPVPASCDEPLTYPMLPIPPRSLDELPGANGPERTLEALRMTVFRDALTFADALQFASQSAGGGIRAGVLRVAASPESFAINLDGYSLVPGVRISGRLRIAGGSASGRFRVSGSAASHGTIRYADQRLVGDLGGQHFDVPSTPRERQALRAEPPPAGPVPAAVLP